MNPALLDQKIFLWINSLHAEWLNPVMVFLSGQLLWFPFIILFLYRARTLPTKRSFYLFVLFLVLLLVSSDVTSSYIFKNVFGRLRPCRLEELKPLIYQFGQKCGGKYGFISSHASNSFALVTFAVIALRDVLKPLWPYFILPVAVSWSRVYLGVHYPGDVIVGALNGITLALIFGTLFRKIRP